MGGACSDEQPQRRRVQSVENYRARKPSEAMSINTEKAPFDDTVRSIPDNAALEAMSEEVILLSTRNANLEQELDEMRSQIERNLDVADPDNLSIEILTLCKTLKIEVNAILMNDKVTDSIDIAIDILEIDTDFEYLMRVNDNKQLFLLLDYLKKKRMTDTIQRVVAMEVFRTYYESINVQDDEEGGTGSAAPKDPELEAVYTFCTDQLNVDSKRLSDIDDIVRKRVRIEQRIGTDIFD